MKLLISLIVFLSFPFFTNKVFSEQINSFNEKIDITSKGTVQVHETIEYDFGSEYRHGIVRTVPFIKTNNDNQRFKLNFSVVSVTNEDGINIPYSVSRDNENLNIKIGDKNLTVTGTKTYKIFYIVSGALTYFSDHDELYWNVTGNDWDIPIQKVNALISLPNNIPVDNVSSVCYTGNYGSNSQECTVNISSAGINLSTTMELPARQGITLAVKFPKGYVEQLEPEEISGFWDKIDPTAKLILELLIGLIIVAFILFWYVTIPILIFLKWNSDRKNTNSKQRIVTAWFSSPKTLGYKTMTPAEVGTLIDKSADPRDFSATLIDLAQRGYLKIKMENGKVQSFELLQNYSSDGTLLQFEKYVLAALFSSSQAGEVVTLRSIEQDFEFSKKFSNFKKSVEDKMFEDKLFSEKLSTINTIFVVASVLSVATFNIPLLITSLFLGRKSAKRTDIGIENYSEAVSLKNFLVSQTDQLNFQAENQMFFEKLLPYATAFGVEKIWAKRFENFQFTQPSWVEGNDNFANALFVNSLVNSVNHSVVTASNISSTRSSSGFSSGFSGGLSGGGGGGGGGGSW